jgi:hypothetical protein
MRLLARVVFLILLSSLLFAAAAHASAYVLAELRQLVTASDDIVVGTLQNVGSIEEDGRIMGQGDLLVERVMWSRARPGETLSLRWYTASKVTGGIVALDQSERTSQLWFLTRDRNGSVSASRQRMTPEDAGTVLDTLAAYPYRVIAPDREPGQAAVVTLEFRNATARAIAVPAVRNVNGLLTYGDGFALKTSVYPDDRARAPLSLRTNASFHHDPTLPAVVLSPGESSRVEIPFSALYDSLPPGLCQVDVGVNGHTTQHRFRMISRWVNALTRVRGTPAEGPFHVQTIRSRAPEAKSAIIELLSNRDMATAVSPDLMQLCDSLETDMRGQVMLALVHTSTKPEERIDFFMDRIDDSAPAVADAALFSASAVLGGTNIQYRRDEVIQRLIERLGDEDPKVRHSAASHLSDLHATAALPDLQRLVGNDASEDVRRSAQWAIDTIEGRKCCTCRDKAKVIP